MVAERGGSAWPLGGFLPTGTPTCPAGYAPNAAIREHLLDADDRELPFVSGHLNEIATAELLVASLPSAQGRDLADYGVDHSRHGEEARTAALLDWASPDAEIVSIRA
jgi:hypothetical protein